jgi:hypothetical protein
MMKGSRSMSNLEMLEMLSPQNHAIALIDYQPAMYQGVQSHDRLVTDKSQIGRRRSRPNLSL